MPNTVLSGVISSRDQRSIRAGAAIAHSQAHRLDSVSHGIVAPSLGVHVPVQQYLHTHVHVGAHVLSVACQLNSTKPEACHGGKCEATW